MSANTIASPALTDRLSEGARSVGAVLGWVVGAIGTHALAPIAAWVRADPVGSTARIAVALAVCGTVHNAAFGQHGTHASPWFGAAEAVTSPVVPAAEAAPKRARIADPVVFGIQSELTDRGFYSGAIDGLAGGRTREAIMAYEASVGIATRGEPTNALLERIRLGPVASLPKPDAKRDDVATGSVDPTEVIDEGERVLLVQRGLVAYGKAIAADGVIGPMTRGAIEEFEGAHGMPITGEASAALVARMRAEGLI